MLRRSSSFRRAVRSRSAADVNQNRHESDDSVKAATSGSSSSSSILIQGSLSTLSKGKAKWQTQYAVLTCTTKGAHLSLHKDSKSWTSFRSFPELCVFLTGSGFRILVDGNLRLEMRSLSDVLCLQFETPFMAQAWKAALERAISLASIQAATVDVSDAASSGGAAPFPAPSVTGRQQLLVGGSDGASALRFAREEELAALRHRAAQTREQISAIAKQTSALEAQFVALVENLARELSGCQSG